MTDAGAPGDAESEAVPADAADGGLGLLLLEAGPPVLDGCVPPTIGIEPILPSSCTYPGPVRDSGVDLNQVALVYTASDQTQYAVGRNVSAVCDVGWQYVDNLSQIEVCGATCDFFRSNPDAKLDLYFGCLAKGLE